MKTQIEEVCKLLGLEDTKLTISIENGSPYNFNYLAKILSELHEADWDEIIDADLIQDIYVEGDVELKTSVMINSVNLHFKDMWSETIKTYIENTEPRNFYLNDCNGEDLKLYGAYGVVVQDSEFDKLLIEGPMISLYRCKIKELALNTKEAQQIELIDCEIESVSYIEGTSSKDFKGDFTYEKDGTAMDDFGRFVFDLSTKGDEKYDGARDAYDSGLFNFNKK